MDKLKELCGERPPILLNGLQFRALFQWLSASQKAIPKSNPGDQLALPPVTSRKIGDSFERLGSVSMRPTQPAD